MIGSCLINFHFTNEAQLDFTFTDKTHIIITELETKGKTSQNKYINIFE